MREADVASIYKALGDPNRIKIVQILSDGEKCGCQLLGAFAFSQPTLSHHMKILCDSGLVVARKEGKWSHYSLCCDTLAAMQDFISGLSCCKGDVSECKVSGC